MAQYALHPSPQMFHSRRFLIGPPLLMVAAFCFGLVLVQSPSQSQDQPVAASHPASKTSSTPSKLSSKLSPVAPPTPATLSTAQTETITNASTSPTVAASTSTTYVSSSTATTNPQLSNAYTAKNGTKPKMVLTTTVNALTKTLDNLIK